MKKNFPLELPNKAAARVVDSIKSDIRKYLKRERRKTLPDGVDFWDFDCRIGQNDLEAKAVHEKEITASIDFALSENWTSIYIEILAKPGVRTSKKKEVSKEGPQATDF